MNTGSGAGGGMSDPMGGSSDYPSAGGGSGSSQQGQPSQSSGRSSGGSSAVSGAPGSGTSDSTAPSDVGDGSDDDIVARQLREAAQKESDPELREKLWDEYRKYKNTLN